jgi:hypothetical protein
MLIAERGGRAGVAGAGRELPGRRPLRGGPRQAGAPQVVEVDLGSPQRPAGGLPGRVQRVPAEPPSLGSGQERRGPLGADVGPQVALQARHDVRRDAYGPATGFGLGRTEFEPATDVVGRAVDVDPAMQEVDVSALEAQHLPQAEVRNFDRHAAYVVVAFVAGG